MNCRRQVMVNLMPNPSFDGDNLLEHQVAVVEGDQITSVVEQVSPAQNERAQCRHVDSMPRKCRQAVEEGSIVSATMGVRYVRHPSFRFEPLVLGVGDKRLGSTQRIKYSSPLFRSVWNTLGVCLLSAQIF